MQVLGLRFLGVQITFTKNKKPVYAILGSRHVKQMHESDRLLAVALWYLTHHSEEEALDTVRQRIRAYNEASGTPNTDTGGYHETLTRFFLNGVSAHIAAHKDSPLAEPPASLLCSPMADKDWPLRFYSRERLFSAPARHQWVEPDFTTSQ